MYLTPSSKQGFYLHRSLQCPKQPARFTSDSGKVLPVRDEIHALQAMTERYVEAALPSLDLRITRLPRGLCRGLEATLCEVLALLRDRRRYLKLLQSLELALWNRLIKGDKDPLQSELRCIERRHGFGMVYSLPARMHTPLEWLAILRTGRPLHDGVFSRCLHGADSHRIQFAVLALDMDSRPKAYRSLKNASELFRRLGDEHGAALLNWRGTGYEEEAASSKSSYSLWDPLFDSYERNFSSPEYLSEVLSHFPLLKTG